jgi:allantoinase
VIEINDITMCVGKSQSGEHFYQMIVDQFDQLYKDSEQSGRVMALCLHPFVSNQPHRQKYLERALEYVSRCDGVWLTTSDEIAAHYAANYLCAEYERQLGGESPLSSLMAAKD